MIPYDIFNHVVSLSSTLLFQEGTGEVVGDVAGEDQASSTVKAICRICFSGENEGSERAMKMLPCKVCNRKYHRSCVKNWAENRGSVMSNACGIF